MVETLKEKKVLITVGTLFTIITVVATLIRISSNFENAITNNKEDIGAVQFQQAINTQEITDAKITNATVKTQLEIIIKSLEKVEKKINICSNKSVYSN